MAKHEEIIANQEALTEAANQCVLALDLVKSAIERSGIEVADGTPVSEYGGMIGGCIRPSGTLEVTENGQHDVTEYASVNVNVATGGGCGEINTGTCTIKVTVPASSNYYFAYEKVSGGDVAYQIDRNYTDGTVTKTVRCDSVMYIQASNIKGAEISGGELLRLASGYGVAYKAPSIAGAAATITLSS